MPFPLRPVVEVIWLDMGTGDRLVAPASQIQGHPLNPTPATGLVMRTVGSVHLERLSCGHIYAPSLFHDQMRFARSHRCKTCGAMAD